MASKSMMRTFELKTALMLVLMFMILMRLVWMDLRSYVVSYAPEHYKVLSDSSHCNASGLSKGYQLKRPNWAESRVYHRLVQESCKRGGFSEGSFIRYNQGILIFCIVLSMLLTRLVTRSWILGLFVGLALMSRGRLIASNGQINADHLIMMGLGAWLLCLEHWLRSASKFALGLSFTFLLLLIDLDPSFIFMSPVGFGFFIIARRLPLGKQHFYVHALPGNVAHFLRLERNSAPPLAWGEGGLFRPLTYTMEHYLKNPKTFVTARKHWAIGLIIVLVLAALAYFLSGRISSGTRMLNLAQWSTFKLWLIAWLGPLDRDLCLSLILMACSMCLNTYWLPGLKALLIFSILGFALSTTGAWFFDSIYGYPNLLSSWMGPHMFFVWEPIFLSFGLLCFYHLSLHAACILSLRRTKTLES